MTLLPELLAQVEGDTTLSYINEAQDYGLTAELAPLVLERASDPRKLKKEMWDACVKICGEREEDRIRFRERVELGHPEARNEVNGEMLWRYGMRMEKSELEGG